LSDAKELAGRLGRFSQLDAQVSLITIVFRAQSGSERQSRVPGRTSPRSYTSQRNR
jgi:hypothetical protein